MINFILLLLIYISIYIILSISLNVIVGYTGLLSLCHAAFFGIGAYCYSILSINSNLPHIIIILIAGLISSFFGFIIGLPTLRLKGDYLAIATLGFGEIVRNVIINWDKLTHGPMGINNIPPIKILFIEFSPYNKISYLILVLIFVLICYFVVYIITKTRIGRALEAIREDEIAASSLGINIIKYKIFSFTLGAFFAGIAGVLYASFNQSIFPQTFTFMLSVTLLCMVVLGGLGNILGSVIGAVIIVIISEIPRLLGFSSIIPPQLNQIFFGLILILMMIYRPQGILKRKKADFEKYLLTEISLKK